MRKKLVAGNWKMNGTQASVQALLSALVACDTSHANVDVAIFPSAIFLETAVAALSGHYLQVGGQNCYPGTQGAFTGEISAGMLAEVGCHLVLVGHSERRQLFNESALFITQKIASAIDAGLAPIFCVGETHANYLAKETEAVISAQLQDVLRQLTPVQLEKVIIAYEPVWAIGTGLSATPDEIAAVHAFIRQILAESPFQHAKDARILYGGSVKADNASAILTLPNVDGVLVGGASLNASEFLKIIEAAASIACTTA